MSSAAFLALSAQLLLGMVFFVSAATKILRPTAFVQAVRDYRLLPPSAVRPLAYALIASEAFLAVALAAQLAPEIAIPFALVLLLVFAAAGLVTLRRQLEINCGCFGGAEEPVGRLSLARIGMLVTVALVAWAERGGCACSWCWQCLEGGYNYTCCECHSDTSSCGAGCGNVICSTGYRRNLVPEP